MEDHASPTVRDGVSFTPGAVLGSGRLKNPNPVMFSDSLRSLAGGGDRNYQGSEELADDVIHSAWQCKTRA